MRRRSKKLAFSLIGGGVILLGIIGQSSFTLSSQLSSLAQIKDGFSVCFSRLTNTYNGGSSAVLSDSFMQMTEECFAEVKEGLAEGKNFEHLLGPSRFNHLLTDVYWIHRNAGTVNEPKSDESQLRFDRADQLRLDFENAIAARQIQIGSSLRYLQLSLGVMAFLTFTLFALDGLQRRRHRLQNERFDLAAAELRSKEKIQSTIEQASLLLQAALDYNDLENCAKLCHDVILSQQQEINLNSNNMEIDVYLEPDLDITLEIEEDLFCDSWKDEFIPKHSVEHLRQPAKPIEESKKLFIPAFRVSVEQVLERSLDLFHDLFKQNNIFVEIRGAADLYAKVIEEEFEQVLQLILRQSLTRMQNRASGRGQLIVLLEKTGEKIDLTFLDNGSPLSPTDKTLSVAKQLVVDSQGELEWQCSVDFGNFISCKVPQAPLRQTTSITKTTKKQWKELLQSNA